MAHQATKEINLNSFIKRHLDTSRHANERMTKYTIEELRQLCNKSLEIFKQESALGQINPPVIVVGDIHGQFFDLLRMFTSFSKNGSHGSSTNKYAFLGDYVDRGQRSVECVSLVLALKCRFPNKFMILRGNHETRIVNKVYGFYGELHNRFPNEADAMSLWNHFNDVFDWMPLAGMIGNTILCMHGGISPHLTSLDDIRNIKRPTVDPLQNLALDLVWSDPLPGISGFQPNEVRGVSCSFGEDAIKQTCDRLKIKLIVRAHQVMMSGFGFMAGKMLVTVFTASRYQCDTENNGAVMIVNESGKIGFKIFRPDPHDPDFRSKDPAEEYVGNLTNSKSSAKSDKQSSQ